MIAFITGATSGIGKACAYKFAQNGFDLILTGRREERLKKIRDEITKLHKVRVHTLVFDIRNREECKSKVEQLNNEWQQIDVLVNNAGLAAGLGTLQEGDVDNWDKMIDTNIKGLLYITRSIAPLMIKRGKGHIINIGSIAGKEVYPNGNVYCATKHAVDALNKGMRIDMLPYGIKVSAVNPGMADTEFSLVRFNGDTEKAQKVYQGMKPLSGKDIAESVFWCASQPDHVNINDLVIMPTAQANSTTTNRKNTGIEVK